MIDIMTESERNLKNVRQIGTPSEEDKIYIEDAAYRRIHAEDYADKRIFIFMGHTECENNHYTTFVEAAIPVPDITFQQNIPQWSSHAWSDIFQEIRRAYDNSIIVGWAMDIKGFSPRLTPELEVVHREQFGGAHQVLFLMDSVEGEEYFYMNKGNSLQQREGFFIYFGPRPQKPYEADVTVEVPEETVLRSGRSRLLMMKGDKTEQAEEKQDGKHGGRRASSYAMTAAIVLLIGLVGVGVYQDRIKLSNLETVVSTMGNHLEMSKGPDADATQGTGGEGTEEDASETFGLIPIMQLPSGEIQKVDETGANQSDESAGADKDQPDAAQTSADVQNQESGTETDTASGEEDSELSSDVTVTVPDYYIVQRGDTLTGISQKFYGSAEYIEKLADLNHLEDRDDIRVGQKLLLP